VLIVSYVYRLGRFCCPYSVFFREASSRFGGGNSLCNTTDSASGKEKSCSDEPVERFTGFVRGIETSCSQQLEGSFDTFREGGAVGDLSLTKIRS
jgi:hypothetical protein